MDSYVKDIIVPMMESQRRMIEINNKDNKDAWNEFVKDTYTLLIRNLNTKKIPLMMFSEGKFIVKEAAVSRWDKSINQLMKDFGLENDPISISLLSNTNEWNGVQRSYLSREVLDRVIAESGKGIAVEILPSKMLSSPEQSMLTKYENFLHTYFNACTILKKLFLLKT